LYLAYAEDIAVGYSLDGHRRNRILELKIENISIIDRPVWFLQHGGNFCVFISVVTAAI
jgi:hypothetical protein